MEKSTRGFASMDPEKQREIARKGGRNVPASKRSFNNFELASAAGRKGGLTRRKTVVADTIMVASDD